MPKKSTNVVHGKRERKDDEGNISHKQTAEKEIKSAHTVESKISQEIQIANSPSTSRLGLDSTTKCTRQSPVERKGLRTQGIIKCDCNQGRSSQGCINRLIYLEFTTSF